MEPSALLGGTRLGDQRGWVNACSKEAGRRFCGKRTPFIVHWAIMSELVKSAFSRFVRFLSQMWAAEQVAQGGRSRPPRKTKKPLQSENVSSPQGPGHGSGQQIGWLREVAEAIAIALVLAFLFRTFEAEAFVIPTGSMAPTLMGRHKDVVCDSCGFRFQVGASEEVDKITNRPTGRWVIGGTCPNCRRTLPLASNRDGAPPTPSFKGDRILVSKYAYHLWEPERWDVVVFKYPGAATTNFIKRLIGLPNETIRISHGDIFVKGPDDHAFSIARKPPKKILAMLQPVYDDDHPGQALLNAGWPERWSPDLDSPDLDSPNLDSEAATNRASVWRLDALKREWECRAGGQGIDWLRYRHVVPDWDAWQAIAAGERLATGSARPQLISDFVSYNTNESEDTPFAPLFPPRGDQLGLHWVGDIAVEFELEVSNAESNGQVVVELVKGGRVCRAVIQALDGKASFRLVGDGIWPEDQNGPETFSTALHGTGRYQIRLANVDNQLALWTNGKVAVFPYRTDGWHGPTGADLERPIRIGLRGVDARVRHLKVMRDVYYIAHDARFRTFMHDFDWSESPYSRVIWNGNALERFRKMVGEVMSDPSQWAFLGTGQPLEFRMQDDQFFVLGDNSAQSEDGRFWTKEHFVRRELLVGKALAVIWPHTWNWAFGITLPLPIIPNFGDMRIVR